MPHQVRDVLYKEHPRAKERYVLGHGCKDAVVSVPSIMIAVPQLAESFARRSCRKEFYFSNSPAISANELASFLTQKVACKRGIGRKVVVVDSNCVIPRVI
jgi:hypothetical protein